MDALQPRRPVVGLAARLALGLGRHPLDLPHLSLGYQRQLLPRAGMSLGLFLGWPNLEDSARNSDTWLVVRVPIAA
jgi:hypothetical protein